MGQATGAPSETKQDIHLFDCISNLTVKVCILCLLFTAEDPSVFHRCGGCPRSPSWRLVGRQCGRECRRPSHL